MGGKLKNVWKNKWKILEGVWNSLFPNAYVERIAAHRSAICETNVCGFYDAEGRSEKAVIPGKPACEECGCNISWKTHSLSSYCALKDIGLTPLWDVEMTEKEEEDWRKKHNIKNEI